MVKIEEVLFYHIEYIPDLIWSINDRMELLYANQAYIKTIQEVTGKTTKPGDPILAEDFGKEYIDKWRVYYQKALSGDEFSVTESYYNPSSNQYKYGDIRFHPIRNVDGKVTAVTCHNRDITDLHQKKNELAQIIEDKIEQERKSNESETRLRKLSNNVPGVLFQYLLHPDESDQIKFVSDGALAMWKLHPQDCMSDNTKIWNQIVAGGDIENVKKSITESASTLTPWVCQWRNMWPDGSIRWHEGRGTPEKLSDGSIIWDSLIVDITEQKKLEELVERTTNLARVGSWEVDYAKGEEKMYWSPMLKQILEVDSDYDASITKGFEFYEGESQELIQQAVDNLINKAEPFDLELLIATAKGNHRWVRCIGRGEFVNGKCMRIFGSYQDIHDKKTSQTTLSEILNSISKSFIALDHDWRFLFFNREAEKLFNRKSAEVIGKNIWDTLPSIPGTILEELFKRVAKNRKDELKEFLLLGRWYEINAYPSQHGISVYFKNIDERKQSAEKLQKALEEKTNIIESIADAFFTMDKNFIVSYWNHSAEKLLGVKREQLVGKNLWEVFPDAVNLPSYKNYHEVLRAGKPITFEDHYGVWLEVNAYPSDEGITVFFRDITLRKEADERLKKAYEERNQILESIGDAFFAVDNHWTVTYWNRMAEEVLMKSKEEVVGQNLWTVYADAIDSDFYRMYHQAKKSGEIVSFEEHYPTIDKWFEVTAYPSPAGLSVYFKDMTLRKLSYLQVREANERFEKVSEATNEAIWEWNIKKNTIYWGTGFKKLFGHEARKDNLFNGWSDHIFTDDRMRIMNSLNEFLAKADAMVWEEEYRYQKADGTIADVVDRGVVIRDERGSPVRMVGAMQDITFRKEYQKELERLNENLKTNITELKLANEDLEQFAYIASHDLQEPLRMVTSFMDLLKKKYGHLLDERANEYIHFANDGAKRMKTIILDLLTYSRAGKKGALLEQVDLHELIEDFRILRQKIITEKKVIIRSNLLPDVYGLKAPLTQTFHCLLDNAIKYSREDVAPIIHITITDQNDEWLVTVQDNGIGIDKSFFNKIFVLFQRLHNKNHYEGNGIGLAIVKKNVESWGGKVWLESEPGVGSTFYFTIKKKFQSL